MNEFINQKPGKTVSAEDIIRIFTNMNVKAKKIAEDFSQLMVNNPSLAIQELPDFLKKVRDINKHRAYEAVAGGPNHDWTGPILDIIGIMYPPWKKVPEQRD